MAAMSLKLRSMGSHDLDAVHRLEEASSPDPWSRSLFDGELSGPGFDRLWIVAEGVPESGPSILGFGGLLFVADEVHVMNMAVDPAFRRRGIARKVLSSLLVEACDRGAIAATLEVRATNEAALSLYQNLGFVEAGRRPKYYPNGEDAVIMWCHRIDKPEQRDRFPTRAGGRRCLS